MIFKAVKQPAMAYYLIGYEPFDPNAPELERHLVSLRAHRVSSCEWMFKAERGKTLELYRTFGWLDVRGFFAQQLGDGYDWHTIALKADFIFSRLKVAG